MYGIDQEHFAGAQTFLAQDFFLRNLQDADFTREDEPSVIGDVVTTGTQAISVQDRPHDIAIGEDDRSWAIPGFQHRRVILIKILLCLAHIFVAGPGLRDGNHDSQRQVHAVHDHKLQGVIQHGGIAAFLIDDG